MKTIKQINRLLLMLGLLTVILVAAACTSAAPLPSTPPTTKPAPTTTSPVPATTTSPTAAPVTPTPTPTTATPKPTPTPVTPSATVIPSQYTIDVKSKADVGNFLVDSKGMTLYYFTRDVIGKSNASAAVLQNWPIFNATNVIVPTSLNAGDFNIITRDDGQKQTTYKGWPLYYYVKDLAPGDTLGEAVGGIWFVMKVPFYTVMLQTNATLGNYLVDAKGMTLYYTTRDSPGKSNILGSTLTVWPIFNVDTFVVPSSLKASDFGSISHDGQKQVTYKDWPLYYYASDKASGDALGQGVGGVWFVINPDKFPPVASPTSTATPTPTPTPTPTSSGY